MLRVTRLFLDGATHVVDNPRNLIEILLIGSILLVELVNTIHHW